MFLRRLIAISLATASTATVADTLDINLRDSSAQLQYGASMGRDTLGRSELRFGILYADKDNYLGDFGLLVQDDIGGNTSGATVGVGIKIVAGSANANDASAAAIGGQVGFKPITDRRLGIVGQIYASPTILTFGEARRYIETAARVEYEIIPQALVYVGYRTTRFDLKNKPRAKLDDGLHIGLRMTF